MMPSNRFKLGFVAVQTKQRLGFGLRSVAAIAAGLMLAGCATPVPAQPYKLQNGKSLTDAEAATKSTATKTGVVVYDLSFPIFGIEASFQSELVGRWTVVADCTAPNGHAFAVVPTELVSHEVSAKAKKQGYNHFLVECRKKG